MHLVFAFLISTSYADDYKAEAEEMMQLDFDIDSTRSRLKNAPRAAPAPANPYGGYTQDQLVQLGYVQQTYLPQAAPLPLEPNSAVDTVVVFRDRALVTRYRDLHLKSGASTIEFSGLPFGIAADSLYAQVRAGDVKIVGVELDSGATKVEDSEKTEALRKESLALTDELGQIRDRLEALLAQRAFLRASVTGSGADRPMPGLDQIKGTFGYVGETERDLSSKLRAEQKKAEDIGEKLEPMLIKLDNPHATGMTVRIEVETSKEVDVQLGLRYQVFGARWWPSYNARLDEATGRVTLEYYGLVAQTTGEEWDKASLLLSTADPSTSGDLPALAEWHLGQDYGYYNQGVGGQIYGGLGATTDGGSVPVTSTVGPVQSQMTAEVQGSGAAVFAIPGKRDINGNGSEQRLPIGTQTFDSRLEFASVPKVEPAVFQSAKLVYAGSVPLLPGSVSSYVGADYVGSGSILSVVPGEQLDLAFGTDDDFKVERTLVSRQQDFLGGGKKTVRYTFKYKIKITNYGKSAATIDLSDQIPVSDIEHVDVALLPESTPARPATDDDPAGVMHWPLNVAAGQSAEVVLAFSVTAPREVPLTSLEAMF